MPAPAPEDGSGIATRAVELTELAFVSDELGTFTVPLDGEAAGLSHELPEGAVVSIALTFRLGADTDGLVFETVRVGQGEEPVARRAALGGFRAGGPYEIRLPPERLPLGRAHCGTYDMTARLSDVAGIEHAQVKHRFTLVRRLPDAAIEAPDGHAARTPQGDG
ncbi:hypothetical protein ACFY8C_36500 [Streptomyces flavochromogenes]|uniref:Uncharacterized protein n=1 Tax=Streptomyces flavochromogenes TaxID=68199 RepID=A0ABW6Y234_9ACTN|nr:hypothetical protein [Streptomyces flavochromogenes]